MLTHRGFEAWIECDGEQLTSHAAWCDSRTIGATVASVAGKPFGVHWRDCEGGIESFGIVHIDGNVIGGRGLNGVPGRAVAKTSCKVGEETERELVFSNLKTTENEEELAASALRGGGPALARADDKIGTIELRVDLVRYGDFKRPPRFQRQNDTQERFAPRVVHESSKKLGGHQTCLGAERFNPARRSTQPQRPQRRRLPYYPDDDGPHVIFRFSYAPSDVLMARGTITPDPNSNLKPRTSSVASGRAASALPDRDAPPNQPALFLRSETIDVDAPTSQQEPIDLTEDGDPVKPLLAMRSASVAGHVDVVNLLHEQLRQAKEDLEASRLRLQDIKPPQPFSAYQHFKPGEVIDLTDL